MSAVTVINALRMGFSRSMRARHSRVSSTGERRRVRICFAASARVSIGVLRASPPKTAGGKATQICRRLKPAQKYKPRLYGAPEGAPLQTNDSNGRIVEEPAE